MCGPESAPKQRVYLRKETSSPKTMKSWVAKRCAWNNGRGDMSSAGLLVSLLMLIWQMGGVGLERQDFQGCWWIRWGRIYVRRSPSLSL